MFGRKASRGWTTTWPDEAIVVSTVITTASSGGVVDVAAAVDETLLLSLVVGRAPSRQGWQGHGLIPVELSTRRCSRQKRLWQLGHSTQSRSRLWHASQLNGPRFVAVAVGSDVASLLHVAAETAETEEKKWPGWARGDLAPPFSMRASDRLSVLQPLGGGEEPRAGAVAPARGLEGGVESMSETRS